MRICGFILITLASIVLLNACIGGSIDAEFTKEEREWLVYEPNDTLLFQSPSNDTLLTYINYIAEASQVSKRYPIEAELSLKKKSGQELFRILLLKDEKNFKKYIRLENVYRPLNSQLSEPIQVNNNVYQNVYEIAVNDTSNTDIKIWKVYFNKKFGFLKFITKQQQSFELITGQPTS